MIGARLTAVAEYLLVIAVDIAYCGSLCRSAFEHVALRTCVLPDGGRHQPIKLGLP